MRRPVLANLDDLDPQTRNAAEAAARRAGLRLEDWVSEILADRLSHDPVVPFQPQRAAVDELDLFIDRMMKPRRPTKPDERHEARSGQTLASLSRWIENAEEQLGDSRRSTPIEPEQRTLALSDALSALKDRLESVERRVQSEKPPAKLAFPVDDAVRVLSPLADTLAGLRTDVSRLAEQFDRRESPPSTPAIDAIASQIRELKTALTALATRKEIEALDTNLQNVAHYLEKKSPGVSVLPLAGAIDTLHGQVADLSDEMRQGVHVRLTSEIEGIERKIDGLSRNGVDRSVIDFLSSQIVDLRHDLANRAEPEQIERLTGDVAAISTQIAEMRAHQVGRADFAALRMSLEKVCAALAQNVERHETDNFPEQIRNLGEKLDALAHRPEPASAHLEPIADRLTQLTETMAASVNRRVIESEGLQAQFDRLSSQIASILDVSSAWQVPLWERFDAIEAELQQVSISVERDGVDAVVRALEAKLAPTNGVTALHDEAASIAERAARTAIDSLTTGMPQLDDVAVLKDGLVELKALHSLADERSRETLEAVRSALESLFARMSHQAGVAPHAATGFEPADRLEAAVRRLHAATLSQIEEVSAGPEHADLAIAPAQPLQGHAVRTGASIPGQDPELGNVRASFIAAARRAAQNEGSSPAVEANPGAAATGLEVDPSPDTALSPPSLLARLRRSFEGKRRPLLFSIAALMVATGAIRLTSPGQPAAGLRSAAMEDRIPPVQASLSAQTSHPAAASALRPSLAVPARADPSTAAIYWQASALDDQAAAARLFETAAVAGFAPAQRRIAALYERGVGVDRDLAKALAWYERAAQGGNLQAMHHLATLFAAGAGGAPDYAGAARWYNEAAESGLRDSQFNLGILLTRGLGTERNLTRAYQWFDAAARQGDADAAAKRNEIAKRLAPPELAAAKLLSERWRARPVDADANEVRPLDSGQTASLVPGFGGKI